MHELLDDGGPGLWWAHMGPSEFDELKNKLRASRRGAWATMLRGWKCQDPASFFSELGAALQFPYYFEETWDSTARMLGDPNWWPAPFHVLMVNNAEHLLADASFAEVRKLVDVLDAACADGRMKVVFAYWAPDGGDGLDRLSAAGAHLTPLGTVDGLSLQVPSEP
jgi:hypothetical protein